VIIKTTMKRALNDAENDASTCFIITHNGIGAYTVKTIGFAYSSRWFTLETNKTAETSLDCVDLIVAYAKAVAQFDETHTILVCLSYTTSLSRVITALKALLGLPS